MCTTVPERGGFVGWEVNADVCALVVDFGGVGEAGLGEGH